MTPTRRPTAAELQAASNLGILTIGVQLARVIAAAAAKDSWLMTNDRDYREWMQWLIAHLGPESPLKYHCRECHRLPGEDCTTRAGHPLGGGRAPVYHWDRTRTARQVAAERYETSW